MAIYFVIYFIILFFTLFDLFISGKTRQLLLMIMGFIGLIIILVAGLRTDTGTDWFNYKYYFSTIENIPFMRSAMEPGYEILVRSFKLVFGQDYTPFLLFFATCIVTITYFFLYKYSPFPIFSIFLLMSYSMVGSGFGVRQDLAICFSLIAFTFIEQRQVYKFLGIMLLAATIHNSALAFVPAYWIYTFKWNALYVVICVTILVVAVAFSDKILNLFGTVIASRKIQLYMEEGMEKVDNSYMALIKGLSGRLFFLTILIWFVKYRGEENELFNGIFNLYVFGIMLFIIFSPISIIFGRLARYYDIYQIVLIPLAYRDASRLFKIAIFLFVTSFSALKFSSSILNDPAAIYVPYKSVLNE